MMKRLAFLLLMALACGSINAQVTGYDDTKHEIAVSTGAGTNTQIVSIFTRLTEVLVSGVITTVGSGGTMTGYTSYENETEIIPLSAEYFYHISKGIGVGGILCYNGSSRDMYATVNYSSGGSSKEKIGEGSMHNITLMPAVKFDWFRSKYFGSYSKFAIGATLMLEREKMDNGDKLHSNTSVMFNWQASLLGLEAGHPNARAFVELGFGEQGIGVMGLRCKF